MTSPNPKKAPEDHINDIPRCGFKARTGSIIREMMYAQKAPVQSPVSIDAVNKSLRNSFCDLSSWYAI
jgi:hypothetical protein